MKLSVRKLFTPMSGKGKVNTKSKGQATGAGEGPRLSYVLLRHIGIQHRIYIRILLQITNITVFN